MKSLRSKNGELIADLILTTILVITAINFHQPLKTVLLLLSAISFILLLNSIYIRFIKII